MAAASELPVADAVPAPVRTCPFTGRGGPPSQMGRALHAAPAASPARRAPTTERAPAVGSARPGGWWAFCAEARTAEGGA